MFRRALLAGLPLAALLPAAVRANSTPPAAGKAEPEFLPLGEFTVNLPSDASRRRASYVVVAVTIEAEPAAAAALKAISPRVHEAVLTRLMEMSAREQMQPGRTDPLALKDALLVVITKLQHDGVRDVLITKILHS